MRPTREHLAIGSLFLAALLGWANSFSGPFVFDDRPAILANPTLEKFSAALAPPRDGGTVAGRPLVNLSLALNRAVSGTEVWSYHAVNLAIHVCAALILFGLVRRTLSTLRPGSEPSALNSQLSTSTAFSATLLWAVHPLQTAAVTYTIQRAESLMALCFLLTLYAFARGASEDFTGTAAAPGRQGLMRPGAAAVPGWLLVSIIACLCGMACKEVMAVAPFVVLLYDRTFVAGSFAAALRTRAGYYAALASTWLLLGWLVFANSGRAGTAGFNAGISPLDYALTQVAAIPHYLRLALWPSGLVFDYGTAVVAHAATVWPQALLLLALLAGTLVALRRWPRLGFIGAVFFLILAPSSSVVPIATQTIAEHRMYLPLAGLTIGIALGLQAWLKTRAVLAAVLLAVPLIAGTHLRNRDYRSALALWSDTVARRPDNARAHAHLGDVLVQAGRTAEAIARYEAALRLAPGDAQVHNNLGNALAASGQPAEALRHFEASVRLGPASAAAQLNLANALLRASRATEALIPFGAAAKLGPLDPASHYNYGVALVQTRQAEPAIEHFRATLAADRSHVGARVNLANCLLIANRPAEAVAEYEAALRLRPDDPQIRANLDLARRK